MVAVPDGPAPGGAAARTRRSPARAATRSRRSPSFVERDVPEVRRPRAARDRHHGHLRRLVLVLLSLPVAAPATTALRPRGGAILVPDRPLRRRDRARDPPPRVLALLDQGHARPRPGRLRRARHAALPPGHGAQGRRGDVEVEGQHGRPRRRDPGIRRGHAAAVHPVRGTARDGARMEGRRASKGSHRLSSASGAWSTGTRRRSPRAAQGPDGAADLRRGRGPSAARCTRRSRR